MPEGGPQKAFGRMHSEQPKKSARKRANPPRYAVRFEGTDGIEQLGEITINLEKAVTRAIRHWDTYGLKVWVFCLKDGRTVSRKERDAVDPETGCFASEMRTQKGDAL